MSKTSGDPFLLAKQAGDKPDEARPADIKKTARRRPHSFTDPRAASIVGADPAH